MQIYAVCLLSWQLFIMYSSFSIMYVIPFPLCLCYDIVLSVKFFCLFLSCCSLISAGRRCFISRPLIQHCNAPVSVICHSDHSPLQQQKQNKTNSLALKQGTISLFLYTANLLTRSPFFHFFSFPVSASASPLQLPFLSF